MEIKWGRQESYHILKEEKHLLTLLIWALQVAKLNDAERELSEISEKLKASSKGKLMTHETNMYGASPISIALFQAS